MFLYIVVSYNQNFSEIKNFFLKLKKHQRQCSKREKQIYLVRNYEFKPFSYFKPKNEKSKFIWSETRNSNLFYILSLKTRKANLFGQKLEIQTSFI